jgi:hypothetical protein
MAAGRKNQLTKQIGEYLVAAELCRKGLIATTFTGNVPDFDIIATNEDFETIPIQVKAIRTGNWQLDASKFINIYIDIENDIQKVVGKTNLSNPNLVCIFVRIISQAKDEFYIFRLRDLQEIIFERYSEYLIPIKGICPRNKNSTHIAVNIKFLERFKDNWGLIVNQRPTL